MILDHLVFYDGECGLCDHIVQILLKIDKRKILAFAPLQGSTAQSLSSLMPADYLNLDTLVLIENYQAHPQVYLRGKAALRILWLIGGKWALPGAFFFLPAFFYDWIYCLIAKNRHHLFAKTCTLPSPDHKDRFLR